MEHEAHSGTEGSKMGPPAEGPRKWVKAEVQNQELGDFVSIQESGG